MKQNILGLTYDQRQTEFPDPAKYLHRWISGRSFFDFWIMNKNSIWEKRKENTINSFFKMGIYRKGSLC